MTLTRLFRECPSYCHRSSRERALPLDPSNLREEGAFIRSIKLFRESTRRKLMKVRKILKQTEICQPRQWTSLRAIIGCLFVGLVLTVGTRAQGKKTAKPDPMARENVKRGMDQFRQSCAMCHGAAAKGASGPNLIESSLVRHDDNGDLIGNVIREGRRC